MLKASDVKPYVVFISPPSVDRILTLRRGKVDPFNPKPNNQMSVSYLYWLCLPHAVSCCSLLSNQGPVVLRPDDANLGLKFNQSSRFSYSKEF